MTLQALENLREQQSSAPAYFDMFLVFAAVGVALSAGLCNAGHAARRVRVYRAFPNDVKANQR
jgi:hypothetical protein